MLRDFPPEIIAEILRGTDASYLVIVLWTCGNQLLNAKLANCVTEVDLRSSGPVSVVGYPTLLSSLRRLRHLRLSYANAEHMYSSVELARQLALLPPTLLELSLERIDALKPVFFCADEWQQALSPSSSPSSASSLANKSHLELAFPNLTKLRVACASKPALTTLAHLLPSRLQHLELDFYAEVVEYDLLPKSLLTLSAGLKKNERRELWAPVLAQVYPPLVQVLSLSHVDYVAFTSLSIHWCEKLPKNLKTLKLDFRASMEPLKATHISFLPRTLENADLYIDWNDLEDAVASKEIPWPPGLKRLCVHHKLGKIEHDQLHLLPPSLIEIDGVVCSEKRVDLSLLPSKLEKLIYYSSNGTLLRYTPLSKPNETNLKELVTRTARFSTENFRNLPSSITRLFTYRYPTADTLIDLQLALVAEQQGASSSSSGGIPEFPFYFPASLTDLTMACWYREWFIHLPRTLTKLSLVSVAFPEDEMKQEREKNEFALHFDEFEDDWFVDMPRNLTYLDIQWRSSLLVLDYERQPISFGKSPFSTLRNLHTLYLTSTSPIDCCILKSIPPTLKYLVLPSLETIKEKNAVFVPKGLRAIIMSRKTRYTSLAENVIRMMPNAVVQEWKYPTLSDFMEEIDERAKDLTTAEFLQQQYLIQRMRMRNMC